MEGLTRDLEEEPGYRLRGVLSGSWARLSNTPIEVAELEVELDNPVFHLNDSENDEHEPETLPTDPEELRVRWEAEWEKNALIELEQVRANSFQLGYEAARDEYQKQLERAKSDLADDLERLQSMWEDFIGRSQPLLVEFAFEIARALLDFPLPDETRGIVTRALTEAVEQLGGGAPLEIRLHPVDYLRLKENGVVIQLESMNGHIRWESDPTLKEGEWIVQSPAAMIRRLQEELIGALRNRIGLLNAVQNKSKSTENNAA